MINKFYLKEIWQRKHLIIDLDLLALRMFKSDIFKGYHYLMHYDETEGDIVLVTRNNKIKNDK